MTPARLSEDAGAEPTAPGVRGAIARAALIVLGLVTGGIVGSIAALLLGLIDIRC